MGTSGALLEELPAYKLRPAPDALPGRWMTGTQNHEGLAGVAAAVEYLAAIGAACPEYHAAFAGMSGRRQYVHTALAAIRVHEAGLGRSIAQRHSRRGHASRSGASPISPTSASACPTFSITHAERSPREIAQHLALRHIYAWNGNMYALGLSERLGLEERGGFLRLGVMHYNTEAEIARLLNVLDEL